MGKNLIFLRDSRNAKKTMLQIKQLRELQDKYDAISGLMRWLVKIELKGKLVGLQGLEPRTNRL